MQPLSAVIYEQIGVKYKCKITAHYDFLVLIIDPCQIFFFSCGFWMKICPPYYLEEIRVQKLFCPNRVSSIRPQKEKEMEGRNERERKTKKKRIDGNSSLESPTANEAMLPMHMCATHNTHVAKGLSMTCMYSGAQFGKLVFVIMELLSKRYSLFCFQRDEQNESGLPDGIFSNQKSQFG
jgi:hypothetical protein